MTDEQQKARAVDAFLAGEPSADDVHGKALERLFPRQLAADQMPDFAALRTEILQQRGTRRAGRVLPFGRRFAILAAAAITLLAVGVLVFRQPGEMAPPKTGPSAAAAKKMQRESYSGSVDVFYRQATGLVAASQGGKLTLKASEVTALFSFEPSAAVSAVTIETPHGSVSVVGTKFIVDSGAAGLFVSVQTGKVRVHTQGKEFLIKAGEELRMSAETQSTAVTASTTATARYFRQIEDPAVVWPNALQMQARELAREKPATPITLTLENGTTIKGFLQYEDDAVVRVRVPAMAQKELTFRKTEIVERR